MCRFADFPPAAVSRLLIGKFQPAAQRVQGNVIVLSSANPGDLTHQAAWGAVGEAAMLMEEVKQQFDPKGLLNSGRFVYTAR